MEICARMGAVVAILQETGRLILTEVAAHGSPRYIKPLYILLGDLVANCNPIGQKAIFCF